MLPAQIRWGGRWVTASVRNVSAHGLLLCSPQVPPLGAYVELLVGAETITARTVWSENQTCGLRARGRVNFERLQNPATRASRSQSVGQFGARVAREYGAAEQQRDAEKSRAFSYALQYLTAFVVAMLVAGSIGWEVYCTLSAPLSTVASAMEQPR